MYYHLRHSVVAHAVFDVLEVYCFALDHNQPNAPIPTIISPALIKDTTNKWSYVESSFHLDPLDASTFDVAELFNSLKLNDNKHLFKILSQRHTLT